MGKCGCCDCEEEDNFDDLSIKKYNTVISEIRDLRRKIETFDDSVADCNGMFKKINIDMAKKIEEILEDKFKSIAVLEAKVSDINKNILPLLKELKSSDDLVDSMNNSDIFIPCRGTNLTKKHARILWEGNLYQIKHIESLGAYLKEWKPKAKEL